ncbi:MAG: hypothetical protein AABY22_32620 [Nanoarchaeota archaeon]
MDKKQLEQIKVLIPQFIWELEDERLIAKSGILVLRIAGWGRQFECTIFDQTCSRNIWVFLTKEFEDGISVLKLHIERLKEALG